MKKPLLDTTRRDNLAQRLLAALQESQPGSIALFRGSLASGTADAYSDIDLLWEIPDESFQPYIDSLTGILEKVCPVASLRFDPAFHQSSAHRLVYVQFTGIPLFWRLDLEIFARSPHRLPEPDRQDPSAYDPAWSPTHSALMNAVAAIKAMLRGREQDARGLLERAYHRIGKSMPTGATPELILKLCNTITRIDPAQEALAGEVKQLHRQVFSQE